MTDNSSSAGTSRSQGSAAKIKTFKGQQSKALGHVTAATTDRRGFLMTGAALGAGALVTRALPGEDRLLRAPGSPAAGPTNADWAALAAKLSTHTLSRPGDSSYPLDHQLFDPRFDYLRPAGIAYCGTPGDVSTALAFVKKFSLRFRVRSGGHSYAGWSSLNNGLVIDVTKLSHFSAGNGTVTVGAGIDLIPFYQQLAAHGLAVPGGSCPTVGLAGLALGGGIGVLARQFGLTCDAIESVQIVTADGVLRTCDAKAHTDLLWASKGGGGGNFGVTTQFTLRTRELSSLILFYLTWPWSKASRVISAWQGWAPNGPSELWSTFHLITPFGQTPQVSVAGTWLGTVHGATTSIRSLISRVGSSPSINSVREESFLNAMLAEAGCQNLSVHMCNTKPYGVLPRVPAYAKSDFVSQRLNPAGIRAVLNGMTHASQIHNGPAGGVAAIAFDALGGAVNRVRPEATAFVHRNALWGIQYSTSWTSPGSASGVARAHQWLESYYADVHPHGNGQAYQNYVDPDLKNWRQAYYGANYPRLARIKGRYDPHNLFTFPQSITA
jgi:FAD/FMN-containing dehydrogenase